MQFLAEGCDLTFNPGFILFPQQPSEQRTKRNVWRNSCQNTGAALAPSSKSENFPRNEEVLKMKFSIVNGSGRFCV